MIPRYRGRRVLIGPPGVGKTRYLADRVPRIVKRAGRRLDEESSPVLICSLTKAAAVEIGSRVPDLPSRATATLHAHCLRSTCGGAIVVDAALVAEWNQQHPALAISPPSRRKATPDDVVVVARGDMPGDDVAGEYDRLRHRLIPIERMPGRVQRFARRWGRWKRDVGAIDFVDMLEGAAEVPPLAPAVIIVDEAQDLSPLGWRVVRAWAEHAGGLIAVGDSRQALYDPWAGADAGAFEREWRAADERGVLRQSWRVPAAVHGQATRLARLLSNHEPIEFNPRREDCSDAHSPFVEGSVVRCDATWTDPLPAIQEAEELAAGGKSVLFIFSANYMTRPLCSEMRARALCFDNPWRRDDPVWNPLGGEAARAFLPLLDAGRRWTPSGFAAWTRHLRASGTLRRGAKKEIEARAGDGRPVGLSDLQRWFQPDALRQIQDAIARGDRAILDWWQGRVLSRHAAMARYGAAVLLARGEEAITGRTLLHPSTAHASKGGEADHVFLFPDLSYAADQAWLCGGRWRDPVVRAMYVSITRARECLHICEPAGRRFVEL